MTEVRINIAKDFGDEPYGRWPSHGNFSGEKFRHTLLLPALLKHEKVIVEMAGTVGYGSSFLEESFGGLVRFGYFTEDQLTKKLELKHPLKSTVDRVWGYIKKAQAAGLYGHHASKRAEVEEKYQLQNG